MVFDICDALRNPYLPCPGCGKDFGMGLTTQRGFSFIICDCGFQGPSVPSDPPTPVTDEKAYNAWNELKR